MVLADGHKIEERFADSIEPEAKGHDEHYAENQQPR
jgi:hypothetical protein